MAKKRDPYLKTPAAAENYRRTGDPYGQATSREGRLSPAESDYVTGRTPYQPPRKPDLTGMQLPEALDAWITHHGAQHLEDEIYGHVTDGIPAVSPHARKVARSFVSEDRLLNPGRYGMDYGPS